jgi:[methyl-Co(III) methanol-specific corrinoid protein]:coenzyme M methyltransferase
MEIPPFSGKSISARQRLLLSLQGKEVDRPPVICPGGMMTMATCSAMESSGCEWPAAHSDAAAMAKLILATQRETNLECLAAPFCMTVEAEALGCKVDMGTTSIVPHVVSEPLSDASELEGLPEFQPERSGRAPVVLEALNILKNESLPYPVIGAVVGPISLAAMVMEAGKFLRLARREPDMAERLIQFMENVTLQFALAQRAAGADCVMVAEPTATGEVLGGRHFERLAEPSLSRILGALHEQGVPVILHICGDLSRILEELRRLAHNCQAPLAISVDALVSGTLLRKKLTGCVRMGNVDTFLLERGTPSVIDRAVRRAARQFHVVSPACGLVPTTPPENLRALVGAVRRERESGE